MADARTERTAAILLDQYHGALGRELEEIRQANDRGETSLARRRIDDLLARAELGRHLTRSWSVVLAGRPNVGKSSLLNALAGYDRAIVHPTPGTTRDAVTFATAIDGLPVELCDTAGLRSVSTSPRPLGEGQGVRAETATDAALTLTLSQGERGQNDNNVNSGADIPVCLVESSNSGRQECLPHYGEKCGLTLSQREREQNHVERAGIQLAYERLAKADLVILITDRTEPWSEADQSLLDQWPQALLVHNKCDLPLAQGSRPTGLSISALRGDGMDVLLAEISRG